jgi:ACS family hexuronate transporter-like MFS transporter
MLSPASAAAASPPTAEDEAPRQRWVVLFLLFLSIAVNLLDRQVLSVLAPTIRQELGLSNTEYSYILFFFLLGMTLFQLPAGALIDRKGARFGLPFIMAIWSVANGLHAVARNVVHFCVFRFLLGAGECGNYSGGIKVISQWFPPRERALAGGIFNSGTVIGAFIAPPLIVAISAAFGWRMTFVLPSALGLLWIAPWILFYRPREEPAASPGKAPVAASNIPLRSLLRTRQAWGAVLIRALGGPVVHFYWYWLPEYLKTERGFTMEQIGWTAGIPFLFAGLGNLIGGWFSSHLMARGFTADRARKAAFVASVVLCSGSFLVPAAPGPVSALALICAATFGIAVMAATHISQKVLARLAGLTGAGEGVMNMILMLATGVVVDHFSYLPVFLAAGLMPFLALVALFTLVRRIERVEVPA